MPRPIGPSARAVLHALTTGPLSMAALSDCTALSVTELRCVCYRLCVSGRIMIVGARKSGRCRRPVALYALARAVPSGRSYVDLAEVWR